MKRCPTCGRTYTDLSLNFCLEDGTPLSSDPPAGPDPNATIRYPSPRDTAEPPPTEIYHPAPAVTARPAPPPPPPPPRPQQDTQEQQQYSPTPTLAPRKKSNAVWWILGGLAALVVIGIGLVVMIIALASLGANTNTANINSNNREANRNANANTNANANANVANANMTTTPSGPFLDDFSEKKWTVGTSPYGRIWYDNDEYHMSSKKDTYIVMHAPSDDYSTENATVKATARSVDGSVPSAGFGMMVHCGYSKTKELEYYALLIYPSNDPEYSIILHRNGAETQLVPRTKSSAIKPGSTPNQLEVRIRGNDLAFYVNGQSLTHISDTANYRRGRVGFYTSGETEVAFDNLEIDR